MTIIFGLNLCDRVYLSADTRVSRAGNDGVIVDSKDQIIKVEVFSKFISSAFAGNAKMAAFMAGRLATDLPKDMDIRTLFEKAKEIIAPIANEYWEKHGNNQGEGKITVIFGGTNPHKRKNLSGKNIYEKIMDFSKMRGPNASMHLKPALFNEFTRNSGKPLRYPEPSDSLVFSIQIFPPNGFVINDTDWGEYLAYGPGGLTKDHIDPQVLGTVEFEGGDPTHDNLMLSAVLSGIVESQKLKTVSKTFFNLFMDDNGAGVAAAGIRRLNLSTNKAEFVSELAIKDGQFYNRDETGELVKLTPIKDYKDFGSLDLL